MVRTVNEAAYEARRKAILDVALHLIETRGYEQMAIADVLGELKISSGAFYHYFETKPALLLALVERILQEAEKLVLPILQDTQFTALEKLQRFFAVLDEGKRTHRGFVLGYLRVWYGDENSLVRHKLHIGRVQRFTPWLEIIIREGVSQGVFRTDYPDQTARMLMALLEDLGYATAAILCAETHTSDDSMRLEQAVNATVEGLERLLGAPAGCLPRGSQEEMVFWLSSPMAREDEGSEKAQN